MESNTECLKYLERWRDCKALSSRFHRYYVYGEWSDCSQFKEDHTNCLKWKIGNSVDAEKALLQREELIAKETTNACLWELRTTPPLDWPNPGANTEGEKKSDKNIRITNTVG